MHKINRTAFFNVDRVSPLLRLYARLVALELTLKDDDPTNYALGHDVVAMVQKRGDAGLHAKASALNSALGALWCTKTTNAPASVRSHKYPDLRYLRHEVHFPGMTTNGDLATAVQALEELIEELRYQGVRPC